MHITKLRPINCVILSCQSHFVSCTVYSQQKSYKTTEIRRGQTTVSDFDLSDSRKPTMASDSWSGETRAHSIPLNHPNDNDFLWAQHKTLFSFSFQKTNWYFSAVSNDWFFQIILIRDKWAVFCLLFVYSANKLCEKVELISSLFIWSLFGRFYFVLSSISL